MLFSSKNKKLFAYIFLILIISGAIFYYFHKPGEAEAAWWDENWGYRKKIDITNTAGAVLNNFQVSVVIDTEDLINNSKLQSDCGDMRFTDEYGGPLSYWIEENNPGCNSATTTVWVKLPIVYDNKTTPIYFYYGNSSASAGQSGDNTFAFFDDFNDGSINGAKWTMSATGSGGSYSEADGQMQLTSSDNLTGSAVAQTPLLFTNNFVVEWRRNDSEQHYNDFACGYGSLKGETGTAWWHTNPSYGYVCLVQDNYNSYYRRLDSSSYTDLQEHLDGPDAGAWNKYKTFYSGSGGWNWYYSSTSSAYTLLGTGQTDTVYLNNGKYIMLSRGGYSGDIFGGTSKVDYIFVRSYAAVDPVAFVNGVEETYLGPVGLWRFDEGYGTEAHDDSGNNTGTIDGATWQDESMCVAGKCLRFDGSDDYVSVANTINSVKTVSFWVKATSTTSSFIDLNGSAYVKSASGVISATGFTSPTIYVNGEVSSAFAANSWQMITVTTETGLSASALNIGKITQYFGGFIDEVKVYPYARTAEQIKKDYAAGSSGSGASEGAALSMGGASEKWMSDGLVGYWKMDESYWSSTTDEVLDASGNNNNGTPWNGATTTIGKFGNGGNFDGTDDYVNCGNQTNLDLTDKVSMAAWVYIDPASSNNRSIVDKYWNTYSIAINSGNEFYLSYRDETNTLRSVAAASTEGKWHYVVGVIDSDNKAELYVDGALANSSPFIGSSIYSQPTKPLKIGVGGSGSDYKFSGTIDEVRIYNRALSPDEVRKLYDWAPGPVARWKMDEKSGQYAYDSSGNGLNGTLGAAASAGTDDPAWTRGRFGNALNFDGTNDYVSVGNNNSLNIGYGDFTVSGWIYSNNLDSDQYYDEVIFSKYQDVNNRFYFRLRKSNMIQFYSVVNGTIYDSSDDTLTSDFTKNQWYYFTAVIDKAANVMYVYKNGFLVGTGDAINAPGVNIANSGSARIGSYPTDWYFNGKLDDIKIYNYARTQKQVIEDMNAGHPAGGSPVGSAVAWWKMDEGFGTTAHDQTNNKNDLTLSNPVSWTMDGKYGKAYHGTSTNWTYRTDDSDFDVADSDDYSISLWFKSSSASNPSELEYLVNKMSASAGYGLYFGPAGDLAFAIDDDTTWGPDDRASSTADVYDNEWHHAVAVKTATSSIKLYIDKKLAGSDTSIAAIATLANSASLYIGGKDGADNGNEFTGDLDEIKIFRYAMNEDEIETEYNRGVALVMGSLSSDSGGAASSSAASAYCVPGDAAQCSPPVGEWKFDEKSGTTAYDSSGNNNNGTLGGGTAAYMPVWTRGKYGNGLLFDGVDDRVDGGGSIDLVAPGKFTLSAWVKTSNTTAAKSVMHYFYHYDGNEGIEWRTNTSNNMYVRFGDGSSGYSNTGSNILNTNSWNQIALTWDGSNLQLWMNGKKDGNSAASPGPLARDPAKKISIGGDFARWNGTIDSVLIFNYARTPAQIAWDYNRGQPVVWYGFNECQGTTAHNEINKSDNGMITIGGTGSQNYVGSCASSSASYVWYNGRYGKVNKAISLDGTDDVVTITNSSTIDLNNGNLASGMSFAVWIKADSDGEGDAGQIFWKGNNTYLRVSGESGGRLNIDASLDLATSDATLSLSAPVTTGTWNHIAMVWQDDDDDEITLYVNGINKGSSTDGSGQAAAEANNLLIGGTTTANFDGLIDEFKIFNYPLTAEQVKTEYSGGAVRFGG